MADLAGKTLGVYVLENSLGKGGMATVYRAYQATIKRYVAIKVMAADIANDPGFVERFSREAEVIASLQHPHILPVIDYGESDGVHYLVMRYLEGGSLEDRMRNKPLTATEAARFIEQIASALDYAHKRGVIHRDFKASNVLLDDENNTYLTDFGIARLAGNTSKLTATGTVMGTPAYMSPEQAMGRPVDGRSDIYSLGVVVYEMMTRRLPFVADTPAALVFQHVYEQPTAPRRLNPGISEVLEAVILRALAKDPDDRYQTALDMSRAFTEAVQDTSAAAVSDDSDGTMVGGPMAPMYVSPSGHGTPAKPSTPYSSNPVSPTSPLNRASGGTKVPTKPDIVPGLPHTPTEAAVAPQKRGLPIALIAVVVLVLLVLVGAGFAVVGITGQNNTNSTSTAQAIVVANTNSTGTAQAVAVSNATSAGQTLVAMIALSATATNTATFTPSATNTPSFTPTVTATASHTPTNTLTSTPLPTDTPNATMTTVAQQISTVAAFQAGQTATQQQAVVNATKQAAAQALDQTATANAPTNVPTDIPITPPTDVPVPTVSGNSGGAYTGDPNTVMSALQNDGLLTAVTGQLVLQPFAYDLKTTDANSFIWQVPQANMAVGDFIMSAQVSWTNANTDDACGFLFHFTKPSSNVNSFHSVFVDPGGHERAITHITNQDDIADSTVSSSLINTSPNGSNTLLLIGQGNAFRLFVNGKRVASFSPKTRMDGGALTVGADTGAKSGLVCHFSNAWAWQLNSGSISSSGGNGGAVDLATGLLSNTPDTVIAALEQANIIPSGVATQVIQKQAAQLSLSSYKSGQGGQYSDLSPSAVQNLVLSVDLTMSMPESGNCGLFFNGDLTNLTYKNAVFLESDGSYEGFDLVNGNWSNPVAGSSGANGPFTVDGTTVNRLTLIVLNSQITLYVNGKPLMNYADHVLDSKHGGLVGFYLDKYKSSVNTVSCIYKNATLWQLP